MYYPRICLGFRSRGVSLVFWCVWCCVCFVIGLLVCACLMACLLDVVFVLVVGVVVVHVRRGVIVALGVVVIVCVIVLVLLKCLRVVFVLLHYPRARSGIQHIGVLLVFSCY